MSITYDPQALRRFHMDHLNTVLLPFWLSRSIDEECGGYFTCFDNSGRNLLSEDKFTWSQGRMVWLLAKLATMEGLADKERRRYLSLSRSGATFLIRHCLLDNGNCTFLTDRRGNPKAQIPGQAYDTSAFADCFVILGLAMYSAVSADASALAFAHRLYDSVLSRLDGNAFKTEPYPTPSGYRAHSIPMIMLNVSQELADALRAFRDPRSEDLERRADGYLAEIMDHFVRDDLLYEMINTYTPLGAETLLERYVNPGHTLEDMWFVMHQARARGDRDTIERAAAVMRKTFEVGWDQEYGGLFLFADRDGGMPRGSIAGVENEEMVRKVLGDWSNKLWWPHSEALYSTLLAFILTGDQRMFELYRQAHDYTFRTFPNPDPAIGEWIQIRDRSGTPEQKVVALPVKDPYHVIRNLILIVQLLDQVIAAAR